MKEELLEKEAEKALQCMPYGYIRSPEDKIVFTDGFKEGYAFGFKTKINKTTISDAPAIPTPETKCNECGKLCTPSEMTDDRRMCKDCYIKWLEGQYAELKEINEGYCRSRDRLISIGFPNFKDCKEYAEQLTKAKEIIRELLTCARNYPESNKQKMQKAEQFLKEAHLD